MVRGWRHESAHPLLQGNSRAKHCARREFSAGTAYTDVEKLGSLIGDSEAAQSLATAEAASTTHEAQGMQGGSGVIGSLGQAGLDCGYRRRHSRCQTHPDTEKED